MAVMIYASGEAAAKRHYDKHIKPNKGTQRYSWLTHDNNVQTAIGRDGIPLQLKVLTRRESYPQGSTVLSKNEIALYNSCIDVW